MPTCAAIIRTEKWSRGWVDAMTDDDVRRILARYKEHVTFWGIRYDLIQRELWDFANALGRDYNNVLGVYELLPPQREPPEFGASPDYSHWQS